MGREGAQVRRRPVRAVLLAVAVAVLLAGCEAAPPPPEAGGRVTLVWYCWNGIYYPRDPQATPRFWAGWSPAPSPALDIRRRDDGGFETTGVVRVDGTTSAVFTADSGAVIPMVPQDPGRAYPAVCLPNPAS